MYRLLGSKSLTNGISATTMANWEQYADQSINLHDKYKIINCIDGSDDQDTATIKQLNDVKNNGVNSVAWSKIIEFPITPIASSDIGQLIPTIDSSGNVVFIQTATPTINKSIFSYNSSSGNQEWVVINHTYISDFNSTVNSLISALTITISQISDLNNWNLNNSNYYLELASLDTTSSSNNNIIKIVNSVPIWSTLSSSDIPSISYSKISDLSSYNPN